MQIDIISLIMYNAAINNLQRIEMGNSGQTPYTIEELISAIRENRNIAKYRTKQRWWVLF